MRSAPKSFRELGWETYAWLIYSLPFLFTTLTAPFPPLQKSAMLASYVLFLPLYFGGYFVRTPAILWIVAAMDLIAFINSPWNPSAASFFIYAAACIANGFPPRTAAKVLIAQLALGAAASFL